MTLEAVIGLEVHVEISTESKIFCGCKNDFHAPPNTNVCPVCLGFPGVLPVLNCAMVEKTVAVGIALHCTISRWSKMDRKNYFYPDQSKNYQISQYDLPVCHDGYLDTELPGGTRRIRIRRAHIEEDTARNVHTLTGNQSGVDFNRCGVPLLEIVTEPDLASADDAYAFLTELKQILQYLGVSDCNMEEGSLRAEPNISVRESGSDTLGTKTEIKNVASFSGVQKAIEYEIGRQSKILQSGGSVGQETRGWDADRAVTLPQRSKESAHDYRYFPEPDLPPIVVDQAWEDRIREALPELPRARRTRFQTQYGLSGFDTSILTMTRAMADYFESTVAAGAPPKSAANWVKGDLQALWQERSCEPIASPVAPERLAEMIELIAKGSISGKIGKDLLREMFDSGRPPAELVAEKGLEQISDVDELSAIVTKVVRENPGPAQDYSAGKTRARGYLVGQIMKATEGKANPQLANQLLDEALREELKE